MKRWIVATALPLALTGRALAQPAPAPSPSPQVTVVKAARLFDGTKDTLVRDGVVVVEGGRIKAVGSGLTAPAGATVIDLGDATLLPGFIDAHVHLTGESGDDWYKDAVDGLRRGVPEQAIRATGLARRTLMAGFTTVRNLGASDFMDVGLRNAINAERGAGPAHAGRRHARSARAAGTATRRASPTSSSGARPGSPTASRAGPTASATPSASRSSTAPT